MPFVIHVGDSIPFGFALADRSQNYATVAITTPPATFWGDANTGISSRTLQQANTDALTYLAPFVRVSRAKSIWVIMFSPNDLAFNQLTGPQCVQQYKLLALTIRTFPGTNKIVLCDPLPRTLATLDGGQTLLGFQTGRAAIMAGFAADGSFWDARCAWGTDAFFGVDGSENDVTKYPDGVNPSALVHSAAHMAGYVTTAFGTV